jgi:hypothetical protein
MMRIERGKEKSVLFMKNRPIILATMLVSALSVMSLAGMVPGGSAWAQEPGTIYDHYESARSDKFTGGIVKAEFQTGQPNVRITLNVPSFLLTLWQDGKEIATYKVGVGMKAYPIYIGDREALQIIWNPPWIPPYSAWVRERGVDSGANIPAGDSRNPLGKVKIPLGDSYLIHQAASASDLGNLVSHGCIRMLRADLYDLTEKIIAARSFPVTSHQIARAKANYRPLVAELDPPLPAEIDYDTLVVEDRVLHIYPDVYERGTNTVMRLRAELEASRVNVSHLDDETLRRMIAQVTRRTQFIVPTSSIEQGRALEDGRVVPLLGGSGRRRRTQ